MPGTEVTEVTVAEKTWELKVPQGLDSIRYMPQIIGILSEWVFVAVNAGIPLDKLLLEGENVQFGFGDFMKAIVVISSKIGDRFDDLSEKVIPFLLQCEPSWIKTHGTPAEIFQALWISLKFHAPYVFGEGVQEALKKSIAAEEAEAEMSSDLKKG